ncbi:HlyD family secretion protein [Leptothoe sp. PORK10 BA2]|uniref:HlyD family secretion protein n=1 Tax=Leptothoe sp. PORK10 BA2 TaxID=3110254 RepID=UPI002B20F972|nr:efflux RND transporter periplasmic adaptor subunit [Leptothoe sp. PORK10 BA2]MEA5463898.1 efflux RND transporter periplasmic adaptor subunit [Leptothoe sp. PORK10 BA2]
MKENQLSDVLSTWAAFPKIAFSRRWLWAGLPFLALLAVLFGRNLLVNGQASDSELLTQAVEQATVPVVITANGTVEAERSINLSPKNAGVVAMLLVEEGDRVTQGQVVALMDDSNLRGELLQVQGQLAQQKANLDLLITGERPEDIARAEAQLAEAEASLQELRSGNRDQEIAQAEARLQRVQTTLQQRETNLQRYESLYSAGAISREEVEQKRADRDVSKAEVREAQESLALQKAGTRTEQIVQAEARTEQQRQSVAALKAGNRAEDIAQAQAQVRSAEGSLQTTEAKLQDTDIKAPFDGVVNQIYAELGAFVSPSVSGGSTESSSSSSILQLSSVRNEVIVNLPESQISKIEVGQPVVIKADAFPGETFTGQVERIAAQATISQNVTSFEVWLSLELPKAEKLKVGMNVETQFEVGRLENALLVPNAAVVRGADGEGVYVLEGDEPVFQVIETGATAQGKTEVVSGLDGDEQVLISPPPEAGTSGGFQFPPR